MNKLTENIKTWDWRVKKSGHTARDFCLKIGISNATFSLYVNEKIKPSLDTYDKIESALRDLGV
jgi:transcriptional regulator with XRE-family HTH domain